MNDYLEELADKAGVYGSHDHCCTEEKPCRAHWIDVARQRLSYLLFSVPLVPPSVNHYKMPGRKPGHWFITKDAQAFIDAVSLIARSTAKQPLPVAGTYYEVKLTVYRRRKLFLSGDSDNMEKVAFDALTKAGAIRDDRYITRHTHRRLPVETAAEERTVYEVRGIEEP